MIRTDKYATDVEHTMLTKLLNQVTTHSEGTKAYHDALDRLMTVIRAYAIAHGLNPLVPQYGYDTRTREFIIP